MPVRGGDDGADPPLRLAPEMASFRALVLAFVTEYLTRWGQSPSYGEIAAGLGSNRTRVKRAVVSLEKAGLLLRNSGTRGLALPDEIERARQTLARAGLLEADRRAEAASATARPQLLARSAERSEDEGAEAPSPTRSVTNPTLLPPAELDYPAARDGQREQRTDGTSGGGD